MRKVLLSVPEIYFGGAEKQFRFLIDGLSKKEDIQLDVIIENSCQIKLQNETNEFIKQYPNINFIMFHSLDAVSNKMAKIFSGYKMRIQLKHVLQEKKYDVIIGYGVLFMLNLPYLKGKAPKVIHSERGDGKLALKNGLTKYCAGKADLVICNSQVAYDRLLENKFPNVSYVHNGVEIDRYFSKAADNDTFKILVPARVEHIKNQIEIIKAASLLKNNKIEINFAGEIQEKEYYQICTDLIEKEKLQQTVHFCGAVGNIYDMYQDSDLVILASLSEGTPNVVLESFAYKRLCIASNIVMNDVLFLNKEMLFDPNDANTLANRIMESMNMSESIKNNIMEQNYGFVKENYSVNAMVDNYYKELR